MKRICLIGLFLLGFFARCHGDEVAWENVGREMVDVRAVVIRPDRQKMLFAGTGKGLYKSEDSGNSWNAVVSVNGQSHGVNFLLFDPADTSVLYAACANGLYCSRNEGKDWKRIFKGKNAFENNCSAVAVLPYALYLGTESGLFVSSDKGKTWHREQGKLGLSQVLNLAWDQKNPNYIYVASVAGVFKSRDRGQYWEKIFAASPTEDAEAKEEGIEEDAGEEKQFSCVRYICIDPNRLNYIYVATSRGLFQSPDRGNSWEQFSTYGLIDADVKILSISLNLKIYAAGKSNIFAYEEERWEELSLGLTARDVRFLTQDSSGHLYAACNNGLFKTLTQIYPSNNRNDLLSFYGKGEPTINEIQEKAIKYAEVEPEKISRWRKQAAKRAILPKVTVSMDTDRNRTVSNSIWGTYGSYNTSGNVVTAPGRYYVGPDDETRYNNNNWGVSLAWELGDLIWSDDQTNIDVRSRLMVQLRDDILDEVTKVYFERLRVKIELDNLSIEERNKRAEKELRLEELTASLDGLTGGYFSSAKKRLSSIHNSIQSKY